MAEGKGEAKGEGDASPPTLSLESVLRATEGVESWKKLCSSSCGIKVPRAKLDDIEGDQQFSTTTERKKGAIRFWLENDPSPSWRRLIIGLDEIEASEAAEKIRKYAEPLAEPTLTCENVLEVLKSVAAKQWDDLAFALRVPVPKRDQITQQFRTPEQKREALVAYWLQVVPNASWEALAGALYFWENSKAVEATKGYAADFKDRTLTIDNLCDVLDDVRNLNDLGLYLHVPNSKRSKKELQNHRSLLKHWMKSHPFPSWKLVGEALFRMEESAVLKKVQKKYLIGSVQSRKIFGDAMKNGYIESVIGKLLTIGAAGSGKTSSKHVILDEDPPQVRKSTPCALRPVQLIRVSTEGEKWRRLDINDLQNTIAGACRVHALSLAAERVVSTESTAAGIPATRTEPSLVKPSQTVKKASKVQKKGESLETQEKMGDVGMNPASKTLLDPSATESDLMKLIEQSPNAQNAKPFSRVERVHFTDSGGQPQFHEVLPVFLRRTTGCLFVLKLSETLDEHPLIEYYDENGELILCIPSAHSNKQILQYCIRSMKSFRSQKGQSNFPTRIVIIGTHRDKEHESAETRQEKDDKLRKMLLPTFEGEVIYCNEKMKEFIFALNAQCPDKEERVVAEHLRTLIVKYCMPKLPDKIPLHWYALELKLQEIAQALGRQVLTKKECFQAAQRLQFDSKSFEEALQYLDDLNILFYYPDILPEVVFCDTQVLLDKITELVEYHYRLRENPDPRSPTTGDRKKFHDHALVTIDFLREFRKHYVKGVFTVEQFLELLRKLLLLADFGASEYFMPCLLKTLESSEVDDHCQPLPMLKTLESSEVDDHCPMTPLVFDINPHGPLNGMFCSLITFLLSPENTYPCPWELHVDMSRTPSCLFRNCVEFIIPKKSGVVTIIDTFKFFVVRCDRSVRPHLLPHVRGAVLKGLERATTTLHYNNIDPQLAFFCKCPNSAGDDHLADVGDEELLICKLSRAETEFTLDHKNWLATVTPLSPAAGSEVEVKQQQIQTEIIATEHKHVQAGSSAKQQGYLRSVEVLGHTSFTYTGRAQSFEWVDHGFKIHFPENALPSDVDECRVHVTASLSGQFQFPEDTELISGIYWIAAPHEFTKPITVDIQHCSARTVHPSSLTYIVAKCTQEDLPYKFNTLNGGVFAPSSRYGSISLTHFSGLGIASRSPRRPSLIQRLVWRRPQDESEIADVKSYCARLYYRSRGILGWEVYFAIMWDLELHVAAIDAKYTGGAATVGPDQEVMFEGENITLDIPKEGLVLESGWTLIPHIHPRITKDQVDRFVPGQRVPSCQLYVKWTGQQEQPVELVRRVDLLGAKEPCNFFLIQLPVLQTPLQVLPGLAQPSPITPGRGPAQTSAVQSESSSRLTAETPIQEGAKALVIQDLADITVYLHPLSRTAVIQLGLVLGLDYNRLKGLIDSSDFLTEMLAGWLQRVDQVQKAGVPTWRRLVEALRDPRVGQNGIASEIEDKQ